MTNEVYEELKAVPSHEELDVEYLRDGRRETVRGYRGPFNEGWVNIVTGTPPLETTTTLNLEDITEVSRVGSPAAHDVGHVT